MGKNELLRSSDSFFAYVRCHTPKQRESLFGIEIPTHRHHLSGKASEQKKTAPVRKMVLEDGEVVFVRMTDDEKAEFFAEVERRVEAKLTMQKVIVERREQRPRSRMTHLKPEHLPYLYGYAPASDSDDDLKDKHGEQKPKDIIPENVNKIEQLSEPISSFSPETKRSEISDISFENLSETQPSDYTLQMNAAGERANNNQSDQPRKKHRCEYFCCRGRRSERAIARRIHFRHWNCSIQ